MGRKGGKNQKRDDNGGYWHATGGGQKINAGEGVVGYKTALTHHVGKQPSGVKTNWLMHEFWFHQSYDDNGKDYALCKIYLNPQGTKNKKAEEEEKEKQKKEAGVAIGDVEALEEQVEQPRTVENHQPHQSQFPPAPLDSYQPKPRDFEYQQQQFWQAPLDSHQLQPYDLAYQQQQCLMMMTLEEGYGVATQQQQQSTLILPPPLQVPDSTSGMMMTGWNNDNITQEDLFDMSNDDILFDIDELIKDVEEEHDVVTQQQQQSTPILPPPLQGQDSTSEMVMTTRSNQNWSDILNGEFFNIDGLLNDVEKGHDVCILENG